jgi:hypothetical protein
MATPISLAIVKLTVADFVGSAWLVAVTCTVTGDGKSAGAVYTPAAVIVPVAALPPETPFTLQLTVVSVVFLTVAVKVSILPSNTEPLGGAIDTVICGGGGGGGWTKAAPPAQPQVQEHSARSATNTILGSEDFLFFCWEGCRMPSELQAKGQRKSRGRDRG